MKKICLYVDDYLKGNRIFDESGIFRDDIFDRFILLKKEFFKVGYDVSTQDINSLAESDIVLYSGNMPKILPLEENIYKSYLIISESPFIRPDNYQKSKHAYFRKIFTWHEGWVDGENYIKLNYAHKFPDFIPKSFDKKLCHLISANKKPPFSGFEELYSKRVEVVRWFENNHPEDFDLYGVGWKDVPFSSKRITKLIGLIPYAKTTLRLLNPVRYPSYCGEVLNKASVSTKYKFSICFENVRGIPGYISEKIFDSFFAGCVPIYFGDEHVDNYIPKNCFIDYRDFSRIDDLYNYISSMDEIMYQSILDSIEKFIQSDDALPFKSDGFVDVIVRSILEDK